MSEPWADSVMKAQQADELAQYHSNDAGISWKWVAILGGVAFLYLKVLK